MTNHIPRVKGALERHVPYIPPQIEYGDEPRRLTGFRDFPASWGYDLDAINISAENEDTILALLQSWLFFGLLVETYGGQPMQLKSSEFITKNEEGAPVISTAMLPKYYWYWKAVSIHISDHEQRAKVVTHAKAVDLCLSTANVVFLRVAAQAARLDAIDGEIWNRRTAILTSISTTVEWIYEARRRAIHFQESYTNSLRPLTWQVPSLQRLLHRAGWCVGETTRMMKELRTTFLYYLSSIDRTLMGKDHSKCNSKDGCKALNMDYADYKRLHFNNSGIICHCSTVGPEIHDVAAVLKRGSIPLVLALNENTFKLLGYEKANPRRYVAISHVWSDGLGNPSENRLNGCMFMHIQQLVNNLYDNGESSVPFWIDTICIPPQENLTPDQREMRKLGIMKMAEIYEQADKVLVLDQSLQKHDADMGYAEAMVRVAISNWATRVWTLQEGRLGRELYFQFQDRAVSTVQMEDSVQDDTNIALVSACLGKQNNKELVENSCAILILRAFATKMTLNSSVAHYATLPPQNDPDEESLRLVAISIKREYDGLSHVRERWAPLIESLSLQSVSFEFDDMLAADIRADRVDLVVGHGADSIRQIRGTIYQAYLETFKGENLVGWSFMIYDVCAGFRNRTTSRLEDETVCFSILLRSRATDRILELETLPWRWSMICKALGKNKIATRCHERRMKVLLSQAGRFKETSDGTIESFHTLPLTMIFWNVTRLGPLGWNWAPFSMLDPAIKIDITSSQSYGMWTPHGLEVLLPAFELDNVMNLDAMPNEGEDVILVLETSEGFGHHPFRESWQRLRFHSNDRTRRHRAGSRLLSWAKNGLITQMVILMEQTRIIDSAIMVQKYHVKGTVYYTKHVAILERVSRDAPLQPGVRELHVGVKWVPRGDRSWRVG